jgi:hypothetical protein
MTDTAWHVPPALIRRFTDHPSTVDDVTASSIEAHLVECSACRLEVASTVAPTALAMSWEAIADRIDRPRAALVERILERAGAGGGLARLVGATPALRRAGLAAVVALSIGAVLLSRSTDAEGPFLVLAPLLPLAAVALSFAPGTDPGTEAALATPVHGSGLLVRRTLAVLLVTFGSLAAAALALPDLDLTAAAWVLPALALSLGALGLGTWWRMEVAVTVMAAGWVSAVSVLRWMAGQDLAYATSPAFSAGGQLVALAVAMLAAATLFVRRERLALVGVLR